jgi:hypothetical protein
VILQQGLLKGSAQIVKVCFPLAILERAIQILAAHMADPPAPVRAPVLQVSDLRALERALISINDGDMRSRGFYPRIFPVQDPIRFATGWVWNNR